MLIARSILFLKIFLGYSSKISFEKSSISFSCLTIENGKEKYKLINVPHKIANVNNLFQVDGSEKIPSAIKGIKANFSDHYKGWKKIKVKNNVIESE